MFTGIIEAFGIITGIERGAGNLNITLESPFSNNLKVDQSVAHNGICLTVVSVKDNQYSVTAIEETIKKTNIGSWKEGDKINLERAMVQGARFDGHMVQGHVDTTAVCKSIEIKSGSWIFNFEYEPNDLLITVEKGSICVNGVSLTVVNSQPHRFSVAIIPYTFENTSFQYLKEGDVVNLEFDVIGKYIARYMQLYLKKNG